jgi:methenyltetrahydrofolate cyclohydrolase
MSDDSAKTSHPQRTVAQYAAALASNAPAPGGGSAVAVAAALAAALAEMVCRFTIGKPAYAAHEPELREAQTKLELARIRLLELADDDEAAYGAYSQAASMPKTTDPQKAERRAALGLALDVAAAVPLTVAEESLAVLESLVPIAKHGNMALSSDVAIASYFAYAALRGAVENVRTNAQMMKSPQVQDLTARSGEILQQGTRLSAMVQEILASRRT